MALLPMFMPILGKPFMSWCLLQAPMWLLRRFLTDEGIEYLREYLNLPSEIVPATLKKSTRPLERGGYVILSAQHCAPCVIKRLLPWL